jgi:hypothetical protein
MRKLCLLVLLGLVVPAGFLSAAPVFIGFEVNQANYVPTPGTTQEVTNQFAPLGIVFSDVASPGHGAVLGKCGPGNGAVALFGFGADFGGCGDTTPNLDILFVDPANENNPAFTTAFSVYNFDGLIRLSAYDIDGVLLGSTQSSSGLLSLSGIGQIARVNLLSLDQDSTTMDDVTFESVTPFNQQIPEPASLLLLGSGLALVALRKRR